jgi:hypothetical protein
MAPARDLRIDFFRGVALLIVVINHIEGWWDRWIIKSWSLISLGFSDAAEIFVFLSGFVFAIAYTPTLERGGLWACLRKALRRALEIYIAYVVASLVVIAIGAMTIEAGPPFYNLDFRIGQHLGPSIVAALTVRFHAYGFDILAMYIPILPAMAALLWVRRQAPWMAWAISGGVWALVSFFPAINFSRWGDGSPWYFNPFAWQFLFYIGLALGDPNRKPAAVRIPKPLAIAGSVGLLAAGVAVMNVMVTMGRNDPSLWQTFDPVFAFLRAWGDKTTVGPLRLAHFFALVYLTTLILPARLAFWSGRVARPIVVAGQHSLEVYAFGLVLSYLGVFWISRGFDSAGQIVLVDLAAAAATIAFGYLVHWWDQLPDRPPTVEKSAVPKAHQTMPAGGKRRGSRASGRR